MLEDETQPLAASLAYQAINPAARECRLLRLHHADLEDETVSCELEVFALEALPPYNALSYTWGPPLPTSGILVNSEDLAVSKSLHDFLRHFRNDATNHRWVFIDQICIDQENDVEKSHQVQLMADIYRKAARVVVWLGCDEIRTSAADRLREAATPSALNTILEHGYFSRLWIVQEILLASKVHVLCGNVWLPWSILEMAVTRFSNTSQTAETATHVTIEAVNLLRDRANNSRRAPTFHELFGKYHGNACHDPRDKVYGLLGLVDHPLRLPVDYGKSDEEVYMDAIQAVYNAYYNGATTGSWSGSSTSRGRLVNQPKNGRNNPTLALWNLGRSMGITKKGEHLARFLRGVQGIWLHKLSPGSGARKHGDVHILSFSRMLFPNLVKSDERHKYTCYDIDGYAGYWEYVLGDIKHRHVCECSRMTNARDRLCENHMDSWTIADGQWTMVRPHWIYEQGSTRDSVFRNI